MILVPNRLEILGPDLTRPINIGRVNNGAGMSRHGNKPPEPRPDV
jgi:hypothetical protein